MDVETEAECFYPVYNANYGFAPPTHESQFNRICFLE